MRKQKHSTLGALTVAISDYNAKVECKGDEDTAGLHGMENMRGETLVQFYNENNFILKKDTQKKYAQEFYNKHPREKCRRHRKPENKTVIGDIRNEQKNQ